ncbi:MAG TPA: Rieske (2Fe-2S) protein [Candidatus Sulfotelmatobacter sp.]|nr:Rieske (2Fe-2S) protein [Candidatus Sulfotelmatobacter sp.]
MIGRLLTQLLDAQAGWARPFGDAVHDALHGLFHRLPPVRDFLNGRWLGHPLHALLTDVPIGVLTLVILLDAVGQSVAADVALTFGVLTLLAAALAGLADYSDTDGRARVRATVHGTLMTVALVLYVLSLALRAAGGERAVSITVSIVAYFVLAAGAYVGGDVVYLLGNMVDRHAWRPAGAKWATLEVGDLPEDRPVKAKSGLQNLVLVRHGERIQALHEQCAHAGGPLSQGTLIDGCLECPWHGSRFRLADGRAVRGPSVYDQPAYEVRTTEAGGYEARRIP